MSKYNKKLINKDKIIMMIMLIKKQLIINNYDNYDN